MDSTAKRLLAEAVAWCSSAEQDGDILAHLWAPVLLPPRLVGDTDSCASLYFLETIPERKALVAAVAGERARLVRLERLSAPGALNDLSSGQLLLYAPDDSLADGAAEIASEGFFNRENAPPLGTWLWYADEGMRMHDHGVRRRSGDTHNHCFPSSYASYVLSWVPPQLLKQSSAGIEANPEGCIGWASEILSVSDADLIQDTAPALP